MQIRSYRNRQSGNLARKVRNTFPVLQSFASPLTQLNSRKHSRDGIGQSNIGGSRDPLRQISYLIGQFSHVSAFLNLAVSTDLQRTVTVLR